MQHNTRITNLTDEGFLDALRDNLAFLRFISDRTQLEEDVEQVLKLTDIQARERITDILMEKRPKDETINRIMALLDGNAVPMPSTPQQPRSEASSPSSAFLHQSVVIAFKSKDSYDQFNSWRVKIRANYAVDLVEEGFMNALNKQIERKVKSREPLFSKLVIKEPKRADRDLLLPNDFEIDILPATVEIKYFVNDNQVNESQFPNLILTKDNSTIRVELDDTSSNNLFSRAQVHNFVRFLAYHCDMLREIPPIDPEALIRAIDDLIEVKRMIGIESLVKMMKEYFQLFSHPESPRGVLLWGPPGTGKTYIISTILLYLGVAPISNPLAAGDFLKGIVGESELMINEIAKRANAVPWMLTALSIDEIDGLVPSRTGGSASEGSINLLSVLLSIIGGNKDTPNLVLFGATNRYESMDEAFLRRMNIKLFVGRPSAKARKEWIQRKLLDSGKIVLNPEYREKFLAEVSKITVNFSNDAMRVFMNYMETELRHTNVVNYDALKKITIKKALAVCMTERIVIADTYLPKWIEEWQVYERIKTMRCPRFDKFLDYSVFSELKQRYFKASPRLFFDLNAKSGQIQLKESRGEEDLTEFIKTLQENPFQCLQLGLIQEKLAEMKNVAKELGELIARMNTEFAKLSSIVEIANITLVDEGRLVDENSLQDRMLLFALDDDKQETMRNLFKILTTSPPPLSPGDFIDDIRLIDTVLTSNEAKAFRTAITEFAALQQNFSLKSKVKTFSILEHIDAPEFNHKEALFMLFQFAVHGDFGCFHYIDASHLYRKGITDESMAIRHISAAVEEASQYPAAMIAIDLDSISEVHKEVSGLKKEMTTPHTELSGGSFGPSISYRPQKPSLMNMVIELAKSNSPVWIAIISKHPFLTNKFKETLDWWTDEERVEQEEAVRKEREQHVDKRCNYCFEHFTEAENRLNSCGRHKFPDALYIDEHYENPQQKKLRKYTRREAEQQIEMNNIPRNKVHYFCCGKSIDDKGELQDKHVGNPIP